MTVRILVVAGGVVRSTWVRTGDEFTVDWLDGRHPPRQAIEQEAARMGSDLHLTLTR